MRKIKSILPIWVKVPLKRVRGFVWGVFYYGKGRFCPVCGRSSRRFHKFGVPSRKDARCVHCGALERHRFLWLYLMNKTDLFDGRSKKMLHVAPEECFESRFKKLLGGNYLSADLLDHRVMVKMDITNIKYPDQSFDIIYCSHVLEHVQDDKKAIREFYRVLKENGWAIFIVPITAEVTFEDPSIVEPQERLKAFGQGDHVRKCGSDYIDRIRKAGFNVRVINANDMFKEDELIYMGITHVGAIYYCTKNSLNS